ncbi:hypothetical protein A7985_02715 [Pseudoalteromonas luteoviolacea]|uniref:Peptidase M4 C-terminal domain-containing protein n=1 Tax=Pseudoalteromonas luteoviolacea TaxID=43657 RepID=A0A1C0TU88_9GAMM|nr:M4 family metallopeptidase [Pseudoalteromonas luteoviolacea]MBQ4812867.1 M4 family metallopeptidase [Pseudoalteromonas luteoviolacea]OCQ22887.1 hypothetical protein A7985_02715 [Pseudoalteromonas luteoviolacea]
MKHLTCAASLAIAALPALATQYQAVPAFTGNATMGINCVHAPGTDLVTNKADKCSQFVPPTNPRIDAQFPTPPTTNNIVYRNAQSKSFAAFEGYPMVVEVDQGKCYLRNELVNTIIAERNVAPEEFTTYSYDCPNGNEESYDDSNMLYKYIVSGAFQPQNDAHLYAGITMQMAVDYLSELYPEQTSLCPAWDAQYCINQMQLRVNYSVDGQTYSSSWDGTYVNLAAGGNAFGQFAHGSSFDIVSHEIGHALLTWNSDLQYSGGEQSAVHEAFSDMTTLAARDYFFKHLQPTADAFQDTPFGQSWQNDQAKKWWFAADRNFNGTPSRYINFPRFDLISVDDYRDIEEASGPHQKSGVLSKFFYLLSNQNGWDIEKAYKLVLSAAKQCFNSNSDIDHAGYCLVRQANDPVLVSTLLQQVGVTPSNSGVNNLQFDVTRLLDEAKYEITDRSFSNSQVDTLKVLVNGVAQVDWTKNTGQGSYSSVKSSHVMLDSGESVIELKVRLTNGQEKNAYRIVYGADTPRCVPETAGLALSSLTVNGQSVIANSGYTFASLQQPVYSLNQFMAQFDAQLNNRHVNVYADFNRNRVFEEKTDLLSNELLLSQSNVTTEVNFDFSNFQHIAAGPMLLRIRIDDAKQSGCAKTATGQVVDLLVDFVQGSDIKTVEFTHQQVNDSMTLTASSTGVENPTYNWYFNGQQVAQDTAAITRQMTETTTVRVDLLSNGQVVQTTEQDVTPVASPRLSFSCTVQQTQCQFSVQHDVLTASPRYLWSFGDSSNTQTTRYTNETFAFDYREYGQFDVTLDLYLDSVNARFTATNRVYVESLPDGVSFDVNVSQDDPLKVTLTPQLGTLNISDLRWNVERVWHQPQDMSGPWDYTFAQFGTHDIYMALTLPNGAIHTIKQTIVLEDVTPPEVVTINSLDVTMKYGWWNSCWTTKTIRGIRDNHTINHAYDYSRGCVNKIEVDATSSANSSIRMEFWIDENKNGVYEAHERNKYGSKLSLSSKSVNVCVVAYTDEQGSSAVPCVPQEGADSMQFKIVK